MIAIIALILAQAVDIEDRRDSAARAAIGRVAPSVVTIETSGGTELVGGSPGAPGRPGGPAVRRGLGPTTGVVVGTDGWIVSSAFNFANKPTSILVAAQGKRHVARLVATDRTRMVTLLKIEAAGLPVPAAVPRAEMRVGQSALAVGRTLSPGLESLPSVSLGIVSALDRVWGKALQTDAKVSPVNYGGPLVDLEGRVLGILVPASPQGEGETAGFEWYDSGIGFAVYFDDVMAAVDRLKGGRDLEKGVLGITLAPGDQHVGPVKVATVAPGGAADKAGIKAGDLITAIHGKAVDTPARMLHALGRLYQGDKIPVSVRREMADLQLPAVELGGPAAATAPPWLGILPSRDDPEQGVLVRAVSAGGPAEKAGIKAGDRIVGVSRGGPAPLPVQNRDSFSQFLEGQMAGSEISLMIRPAGEPKEAKPKAVKVALGAFPGDLAPKADGVPSVKGTTPAGKPPEKLELGVTRKSTASGEGKYLLLVPETYRPDVAHALVVWLHPANKGKDRELEALLLYWERFCAKRNIIMIAPQGEGEAGWTPGDGEWIAQAIAETRDSLAIDKRRIVAHGMGAGGLMAYYLGFHKRDLIRGVATVGAPMGSAPRDRAPGQPLAFFLAAGDRDPAREAVEQTRQKLVDKRFPTILRLMGESGGVYLDDASLESLVDWIDTLDRM